MYFFIINFYFVRYFFWSFFSSFFLIVLSRYDRGFLRDDIFGFFIVQVCQRERERNKEKSS